MMYILLTRKLREALPLITIDESGKEDFLELVGWDEKKFYENMMVIK